MGAAAKQQVRLLPGGIVAAQKSKATPMCLRVYASPVCCLRNEKEPTKFLQVLGVFNDTLLSLGPQSFKNYIYIYIYNYLFTYSMEQSPS